MSDQDEKTTTSEIKPPTRSTTDAPPTSERGDTGDIKPPTPSAPEPPATEGS